MSADPNQITIPGTGRVWLAPLGTVGPADSVVTMPAGWVDVGLSADDGITIATQPTFASVQSLQSLVPVRRFQTGDGATIAADLQQFSSANLAAVFGGGTTTVVTPAGTGGVPPAQYKWVPPRPGTRLPVACIVEWSDGVHHFRMVFPSAFEDQGITVKVARKAEVMLPLRFTVQGSDGVDPFYLLTDAPGFVAS